MFLHTDSETENILFENLKSVFDTDSNTETCLFEDKILVKTEFDTKSKPENAIYYAENSKADKKLRTIGNGHLLMANNSSDSDEGMYRAIADPTLQKRQAAAGELYIPQSGWPFLPYFLHCSHAYIYLFNTPIASVGTHERIAKSSCQNV